MEPPEGKQPQASGGPARPSSGVVRRVPPAQRSAPVRPAPAPGLNWGLLIAAGVVVMVVTFAGLTLFVNRPDDGPDRDVSVAVAPTGGKIGASPSGSDVPAGDAAAPSVDPSRPVNAPPPASVPEEPALPYRSPLALLPDKDGKTLYIAAHTAKQVVVFDVAGGKVSKRIPVPDRPGGMALAPDGKRLYVAGESAAGRVHVIDTGAGKVTGALQAGHTPCALAVSPDGKRLYVCNRFRNDVSVFDLATGKEAKRIPVTREPSGIALTPDGKRAVVANHLPDGPADAKVVATSVNVIDTATDSIVATIRLPDGSIDMQGIAVSPDGRYAYAPHILARYRLPTTQLERGWMNTNALSVIDVQGGTRVNTVLLDGVHLGAANPWDVAITADGAFLCVTHAGTHEISVIDRPKLHEKLDKAAAAKKPAAGGGGATPYAADVANDLGFLNELRRRINLAGKGPRGLALIGTTAYVAEYFSDSVGVVDVKPAPRPDVKSIALGPEVPLPPERLGEMRFHDADHCFQKWQSCASCHPDGRADGLNWDLLNDGLGNPKNVKSLILAHETPPVMALGVRADAKTAVRAGFRHIQFAIVPEEECATVDAYIKSLKPVTSPHPANASAKRGAAVYEKAGCAGCHPKPLLTDLKSHNLGLGLGREKDKAFDTPTLREVWRSGPYLHDGRAATIEEVLTKYNPNDRHGRISKLTPEELADLIAFVLIQ